MRCNRCANSPQEEWPFACSQLVVLDKELIHRARQNDDEAMNALINRHYAYSLKLASSILRNRPEAEDSVQSAFLQVVRNIHRYEERAEFRTWLVRIVMNQCLMCLRRRRRTPVSLDSLRHPQGHEDGSPIDMLATMPASGPTPEERLGTKQVANAVRRGVRGLPPAYRAAVDLYHLDEAPIEVVAKSLHLTTGAVKSRLKRGRAQLRTRLDFCASVA